MLNPGSAATPPENGPSVGRKRKPPGDLIVAKVLLAALLDQVAFRRLDGNSTRLEELDPTIQLVGLA